jgi:Kef-type K+ transport system membrane component KefB
MQTDAIPLIMGILIFLASLISLRLGLSVAIVEMLLGAFLGNLGIIQSEAWMLYLATFGGVVLTFLAGTEIDLVLMREKFRQSFLIGFFSFLCPFLAVFLYTYFLAGWTLPASLIAGTALSTTSLAVVYSVLVESGLNRYEFGKIIMAATFVTDMGTVTALSILFIKPTLYTLLFIVISIIVIVVAMRYSHLLFQHPMIKNKVAEPEVKFVFLLLLIFMLFAGVGDGQAVLPAFVLGLFMAKPREAGKGFVECVEMHGVKNKLRTVAYAIITPVFFIVGGLNMSVPLILSALGLFIVLFCIKIASKFIGVYKFSTKFIPGAGMYTTLLMSTGLTFGTIASVFGYQQGYINQTQYSVLIGVIVASAVIPTVIAEKWFRPVHSEDMGEMEPIR